MYCLLHYTNLFFYRRIFSTLSRVTTGVFVKRVVTLGCMSRFFFRRVIMVTLSRAGRAHHQKGFNTTHLNTYSTPLSMCLSYKLIMLFLLPFCKVSPAGGGWGWFFKISDYFFGWIETYISIGTQSFARRTHFLAIIPNSFWNLCGLKYWLNWVVNLWKSSSQLYLCHSLPWRLVLSL
jgi:hypothetical protein